MLFLPHIRALILERDVCSFIERDLLFVPSILNQGRGSFKSTTLGTWLQFLGDRERLPVYLGSLAHLVVRLR